MAGQSWLYGTSDLVFEDVGQRRAEKALA